MRPGDFSPGNRHRGAGAGRPAAGGFNEAGGFLPRKHGAHRRGRFRTAGFNEAGGFLPRKPVGDGDHVGRRRRCAASMRPGDFSPGNARSWKEPSATTSFNEAGGFLPRKPEDRSVVGHLCSTASMRPGDFSPGNPARWCGRRRSGTCFNEAGGFLPRKRRERERAQRDRVLELQ